ncbi:proteasome-activating nucleotidase [Candidatus Woesearchaeota archaeon]|nr:proteasome-activating nucleotidase [Candidatus Woesearchaeota archaeon]
MAPRSTQGATQVEGREKEILGSIIAGYTTDIQTLEDENRLLKETVKNLKRELEKYQQVPLLVAEIKDIIEDKVLLRLNNGNEFYVGVADDIEELAPGDSVLVEQKNLTVLRKIPLSKSFNVEKFVIVEKPTVSWKDVGGLDRQEEEIKEVIELPLKKPELFKKVGIKPPKGILLYGPPGTGKTLLAKAVATSTDSTFIEVVGSELVQKFIGEGAKLIKEIFLLAREKAPAIIFIDELDALAAKRVDIGTSGEREVQRTFMQLLAEIDGFKPLGNVKIVGCTNRKDILDPAVVRPGRLDRLIQIPHPDEKGIKEIFKIHTKSMQLAKNVNVDRVCKLMKGFSGAEIKASCTEAGYFAIRTNRYKVNEKDFKQAVEKVKQEEKLEGEDFMRMFG